MGVRLAFPQPGLDYARLGALRGTGLIIAAFAIFAATHDSKKELGAVFLSGWTALFFLKTALEYARDILPPTHKSGLGRT